MRVRINKVLEGQRTNGISSTSGELLYPPELDHPVYVMDGWRSLKTDPVIEILEQVGEQVTKFKTENSTYTIDYL